MSRQDIRTVTISGSEVCVEGLGGQNATIRNDGSSTIYVSADPNIKPDADGVLAIFAGGVATYPGTNGTVYLLGTGKAQLCGTDYIDDIFTPIASSGSSGGSGGGGDYVLLPATVSTLGGMIVGDGLIAEPNGRVSVNIASDDEIDDVLGDIFD